MAEVVLLPLRALVEGHREEIKAIVAHHKGRAVAIFGSVARGEETAESDIDFLVEFEQGSSLFDLVRLEDGLEALLSRDVDVVSLGGLLPRDRSIHDDAIWLAAGTACASTTSADVRTSRRSDCPWQGRVRRRRASAPRPRRGRGDRRRGRHSAER